ncbi:serine/threonine-protein kinase [Metapseudomonas otitidis]|uniref:serine/threonine-protein kinase n=1 Tax=Metapseudomonas otitidis TaxID=319939 RepID=UPI00244B4ACA|nr:serine/threonine-protein kinase [Pseudomonas otitidis]MDG9782607.1 serine/threonine protein kinase [Pseudomonas otitidis]MEE1894976.1 serine/threonine-protein kinase [Pseudomonas otitidis]
MINLGELVAGRYEIISHIGRGGMQEVFLARDILLDVNVALKTPQPGQAERRFKNSAIIAAKINHHNVAKTLDYVEEGDRRFLIEEFVDGETLEHKLSKFGFLDPHLGAHVLHHLAKGIRASHRAEVIHRDLKPSNVMTSRGVNLYDLKITDFGIATLTEEVFDEAHRQGDLTNTTSGTVKGALPFMAPEMMFRAPGEKVDCAVDIWSLGAMMFRLLTGEYPFGLFLEAAVNVKTKTRKDWPAFMTSKAQFRPLAIELQRIVDSCLSYDAAERPTADKLVAECEALCYLATEREEGVVSNLIQHGYSGFVTSGQRQVFFSMESVYGTVKPDPHTNRSICFSSFPGSPQQRAHPVLLLKS